MMDQDASNELAPPQPLSLTDAAVFLDIDGTLAPIAPRPEDVRPDARRTDLMERLSLALDGRLAVVSGRTLSDIDRILEGRVAAAAAVHGLVRRQSDGATETADPHPALAAAARAFHDFARRNHGLLLEDKHLSVTLHYRLAPEEGPAARVLAQRLADETGLMLQHGDMVEELRTPGPTKGDSVAAFLARSPFAGAKPIFVGDDVTDEHGFETVAALGGVGVLVGPRRPTAATACLPDVDAVLNWLEAAL